jgi:hypothetical protein
LDASTDLKKLTTKDKKIIEYFPDQIINNVNSTLFNDMIGKKKECLSKIENQDGFNESSLFDKSILMATHFVGRTIANTFLKYFSQPMLRSFCLVYHILCS